MRAECECGPCGSGGGSAVYRMRNTGRGCTCRMQVLDDARETRRMQHRAVVIQWATEPESGF